MDVVLKVMWVVVYRIIPFQFLVIRNSQLVYSIYYIGFISIFNSKVGKWDGVLHWSYMCLQFIFKVILYLDETMYFNDCMDYHYRLVILPCSLTSFIWIQLLGSWFFLLGTMVVAQLGFIFKVGLPQSLMAFILRGSFNLRGSIKRPIWLEI